MTFTIGRGNDIVRLDRFLCPVVMMNEGPTQVCQAIHSVADRIIGKKVEDLFADMGKTWAHLTGDSQLRWYETTAPRLPS